MVFDYKSSGKLTNFVVLVPLISQKDANNADVERIFFPPIEGKYFHASTNTIFEKELLEQFSEAALYNHTTFLGFTNQYNRAESRRQMWAQTELGEQRILNRMRLEEAWFRYTMCGCLHRLGKLNDFQQGELVHFLSIQY